MQKNLLECRQQDNTRLNYGVVVYNGTGAQSMRTTRESGNAIHYTTKSSGHNTSADITVICRNHQVVVGTIRPLQPAAQFL